MARGPHDDQKFTNETKTQLVQRLIVAVEQRHVSWPRAWEVLTDEMKRYEYAISPSGAIAYSAPEGFHDDCVTALALATPSRYPIPHTENFEPLAAPCRHRRFLPNARALT